MCGYWKANLGVKLECLFMLSHGVFSYGFCFSCRCIDLGIELSQVWTTQLV